MAVRFVAVEGDRMVIDLQCSRSSAQWVTLARCSVDEANALFEQARELFAAPPPPQCGHCHHREWEHHAAGRCSGDFPAMNCPCPAFQPPA